MRHIASFLIWFCVLFAVSSFAGEQYFPISLLSEVQQKWFSKHLSAMEEPPLSGLPTQSYRFLYLRTFHRPISLRLNTNSDQSGVLHVKMTDGQGGYEPGKLVVNKTIAVTPSQVHTFLHLLDKCSFWQLTTKEPIEEHNGLITIKSDGAEWVMEGANPARYHIVVRNSPQSGDYRKAALFLLDLSHLKVANVY